MMLAATIAIGVAGGILLAGGIAYSGYTWGRLAIEVAVRGARWAWWRKARIVAGMMLLAFAGWLGVLVLKEMERQYIAAASKRYSDRKFGPNLERVPPYTGPTGLVPDPDYTGPRK